MTDTLIDEERKTLTADDLAKLDDSDFAYIDGDGEKHLPIHDEAHVRAALARFNQTEFDTAADKVSAAKKIVSAAKKFDIEIDPDSPVGESAGLKSETKSRKARGTRELTLQAKCRRMYAGHIEVRKGVTNDATGQTDLAELTGQVIGYETPYEVNDMFGSFSETIHYGAATALLADPSLDVCFLVGHNAALVPLARTGAKAALTLTDTPEGLQVRALVDPRMSGANDLLLGLENGTISQMSVGMQVDPAGDVWSGEDDYGLPNVRDIYRLANIFDASAVAFPANPDTELELASARMAEFPPEITQRAQRLEEIAKRGRQGLLSQAESDDLLHVIRRLFMPTERSAPTAQDSKVAAGLASIGQAIHDTMAAQVKDPDNNTDPTDKKIMTGLKELQAAHANLMHLQAQDGTDDKETNSDAPLGGPDGTQGGGAGAGVPDNQDGTGSRAKTIDIDRDLRARRRSRISA